MDTVVTSEMYFLELAKLGVKAEPPPDGWTTEEWTLDRNNADYSGCTLVQLGVIMAMKQCDKEETHIIADAILCEVIRRLATVSEYYQNEYAAVALRIVEVFENSEKWYS